MFADSQGRRFGMAVVLLSIAGVLPVGLIEAAEETAVRAPVCTARHDAIVAGVFAALAAAALAIWLARSLSRPLREMTDGVHAMARNQPVHWPIRAGGEIGVLANAMDKFARSERLFSTAISSTGDAVFLTALDGEILAWNPAAEELFGYSDDEAIGRKADMLVPPDRTEEYETNVRLHRAQRTVHRYETVRQREDGTRIELEQTVSPVADADGNIIGISVIARDSSECRAAERLLEVAVEAAPSGMLMVDGEGRIALANRQIERQFGYKRDEPVGRKVEMLVSEQHRAAHPTLRAAFAAAPESRAMGAGRDLFARRKDGSEFPVEIGLTPVEVNGEDMVLGAVVDITGRKETEEALALHTRALERSNAELERFAFVASHDLQEPLRTIASFCELLQRRHADRLEGEALEFIDFVIDGANRMKALVNDLLAVSRLREAAVQTEPTPLDELMTASLRDLGGAIGEAGASVTHDPLPTVMGNAGELSQLLRNLIGNGIKFRGDAPPAVHVSARRDRTGAWEISVADNGIGIAPDQRERIFDAFVRLNRRDEFPGTGIGLAVCRRIVERHGGRIWVEPAPAGGTAFRFTLRPAD
jgi:PAS domain S-box-containing protein